MSGDGWGIWAEDDIAATARDYPTTDAARLRSLAATFDSHLNRDKTFTGSEVASMLRDGKR